MLRIIVFVVSLAVSNVVLGNDIEAVQPECILNYGGNPPDFPCDGYISTDPKCNNTFFNTAKTSYYNCSEARIFWNYPMQNLTIIIEAANYTDLRQPYSVTLEAGFMLPIYRVYPSGKEIYISNRTAEQIVETSDENYQVILKYQGPKRLFFYGANIQYKIAPINK